MKIVQGIDKNDVINYLVDGFDVYAIEPSADRLLNLRYETVATILTVIENDNIATFVVGDIEEDRKKVWNNDTQRSG
jgi:hypothetical protein